MTGRQQLKAAVAQLVEHHVANVNVTSSSLVSRSNLTREVHHQLVDEIGGLAEWLCSGLQIRGPRFDSGTRLHSARVVELVDTRDLKSLVLTDVPVQVRPRVPFHQTKLLVYNLKYAAVAQLVEHHVANVNVTSSSLVSRSNFK